MHTGKTELTPTAISKLAIGADCQTYHCGLESLIHPSQRPIACFQSRFNEVKTETRPASDRSLTLNFRDFVDSSEALSNGRRQSGAGREVALYGKSICSSVPSVICADPRLRVPCQLISSSALFTA